MAKPGCPTESRYTTQHVIHSTVRSVVATPQHDNTIKSEPIPTYTVYCYL